jgi:hypothetical protein
MEDLYYATGNGEPTYETFAAHRDSGKTVESELAKLGLSQLGGNAEAAGCGD